MKQFPNALVPVRNRVALGVACHRRERGYGATPEQGRCMGLWRFIARAKKNPALKWRSSDPPPRAPTNGRPGFPHPGAGGRLPMARRGRVLWRFFVPLGGACPPSGARSRRRPLECAIHHHHGEAMCGVLPRRRPSSDFTCGVLGHLHQRGEATHGPSAEQKRHC